MKTLLPLLIFTILHTTAFTQIINISFEKDEIEYKSLIGATHLTEDFTVEDWENMAIFVDFDTPVYLETNEGEIVFYNLGLYSGGEIILAGINLVTFDFADLFLAPFDEILGNTFGAGSFQQHTEIHYLFQDNITYIEFKNLTFLDQEFLELSPEARFNVIISIDHRDGTIKYHYGPSSYTAGILELTDFELYIGFSFEYETEDTYSQTIGILGNDPANPELQIIIDPTSISWNGLDDFPAENTLYTFSFGETTSQTLRQKVDFQAEIFPNPGTSNFNILTENQLTHGRIDIFNSLGQIIASDLPFNSQIIDTKLWTPGMYMIRLSSGTNYQTLKWRKL